MCFLNEEGDFDDWDGFIIIYFQIIGIIVFGYVLGLELDGVFFLVFFEDDFSDELIVFRGVSRVGNCLFVFWIEVVRINIIFCFNIVMDEDVKCLSNGNYGFIFVCFGELFRFVRSIVFIVEGLWEVELLFQIVGILVMFDIRGMYILFIVGGIGNVFCLY